MATETYYVVKCDGRKDARLRRLDSAQCIARAWKAEGRHGVCVLQQTITTKRVYIA